MRSRWLTWYGPVTVFFMKTWLFVAWSCKELSCNLNALKPNSSDYYTLPYRPNLPCLISDIWTLDLALSTERQSARMSEISRLGLYGAEHSKCNRMMTLGFKGLTLHQRETVRKLPFINCTFSLPLEKKQTTITCIVNIVFCNYLHNESEVALLSLL